MSSLYEDISDISDQEVDDVLTTVAAKHQEAAYASHDFHLPYFCCSIPQNRPINIPMQGIVTLINTCAITT